MACISSAVIVGGGIAGLATAVALARQGVHCDVVERAEMQLGASLAFSGRAAMALDELGVYAQVHATGTPLGPDSTAASIRNAAGELVSPGARRPTWPGAKDGVALYRPVFADVMAEAAEAFGVRISKGLSVDAIADAEDAVTVTLSNGETRSYDLLVAADGIGSRTRATATSTNANVSGPSTTDRNYGRVQNGGTAQSPQPGG